jgi:hypothetical protein
MALGTNAAWLKVGIMHDTRGFISVLQAPPACAVPDQDRTFRGDEYRVNAASVTFGRI